MKRGRGFLCPILWINEDKEYLHIKALSTCRAQRSCIRGDEVSWGSGHGILGEVPAQCLEVQSEVAKSRLLEDNLSNVLCTPISCVVACYV